MILAAGSLWACAAEVSGLPPDAAHRRDAAAPGDTVAPADAEVAPADATVTPADSAAPADSTSGCSASSVLALGDTTRAIMVGGVQRSYDVHVPPGYTNTSAVPLVFDLHPKDVTANIWRLATPWTSIADREGFILVRPDGYDKTWNAGRCCEPAMSTVDDVAFVRAMVTELKNDACIDPKRIYATGCSNGGGMAYRLACDAADIFAAIAPVDFDCLTGPTNTPSCANCTPARPVPVCQVRGLLDPLVPYYGGSTIVVAGIEFPGAEANFSTWAALNGCTGQPQTHPTYPACKRYTTCAGGAETTLCTNPVGLHCTDYAAFGTVEIAWDLFSRHRLP